MLIGIGAVPSLTDGAEHDEEDKTEDRRGAEGDRAGGVANEEALARFGEPVLLEPLP